MTEISIRDLIALASYYRGKYWCAINNKEQQGCIDDLNSKAVTWEMEIDKRSEELKNNWTTNPTIKTGQ